MNLHPMDQTAIASFWLERGGAVTEQATTPEIERRSRASTISATVVGVFSVGWAGLFATLGLTQLWRFHMHAYDIGIFSQATWLLSRFKDPFVTIRGLQIFADHSSYILLAIVPLYWLFPTAATLVVVTVLAMTATAPLVYVVARRAGASPLLAAVTGVLVLVQPAVQWQVRDSFHPEVLVVPLVVGAFALLQRDRDVWAITLIAVALTAKEDVGLLIVPLGLAIAYFLGKRRTGWLIAALGLGAFLLNFLVLLPAWSPTGELLYSYRYAQFGTTPVDVVVGLLTSPSEWWAVITDGTRMTYVATLVFAMPLAILAPRWLLVGVPMLAANLFSNHGYQYEIEYHYAAYLVVAVVLAAAFGAASVSRWDRRSLRIAAVVVAIVAASATWFVAGPRTGWPAAHVNQTQIRAILEVIPDDESVSAWTTLVPPLANRETVYLFPSPWDLAYYGAEGIEDPDPSKVDWLFIRSDSYRTFDDIIDGIIESGDWEVVVDDPPFTLLRRK
ncbi:MAG: hypothetical protein BMS9Abin12_0303 [Acidimicrobiia bacterium]|nr:MAG: hypothetical protein BMS9Abin12_0303 [Acidimicrobiia bacterium]